MISAGSSDAYTYILALILGCGIVLHGQVVCAQVENTINESESIEQKTCGENCADPIDVDLVQLVEDSKENE